MQALLPVLAAGAAAWAISVSGVKTNPPFALLLFLVSALLMAIYLVSHRLRGLAGKKRMSLIGVFAVMGAVVFGLAGYFLTNPPPEPEQPPPVDLGARQDANEAKIGIAELRQQFKALEGSLQTERAAKQAALDALNDRARRKVVSEALGAFMLRGREIQRSCGNESVPPPQAEADKWTGEVEKYLEANLGASFVARFRNFSGLPMSATSIASVPHRNLWSGITTRMARLEQFIQELSR